MCAVQSTEGDRKLLTTKSLGIAPPRPRPPLLARTLLQGPPTSISLDGRSFSEPAINSPLSLESIFSEVGLYVG